MQLHVSALTVLSIFVTHPVICWISTAKEREGD
jgi:hypothetical protein